MNTILIGAEGLDGANFLCSCLTMSDEIYFNDYDLQKKIKFFFECMSKVHRNNGLPIWNDCSMLFSSCARAKEKLSFSTYQSKVEMFENKILINKVRLPVFWPLSIHMAKNPEDSLSKLFEPTYFIGLINPDLFISLRTVLIDSDFIDNSIPDFNLCTVAEFNLLSRDLQEKIKCNYQSKVDRLFECKISLIHKWHMSNMQCHINDMNIIEKERENLHLYKEGNDLLKTKITHEWDCNWFLNEDETFENISRFYSEMNLGKCNEKLVREMYKVWIRRIDYFKKSHRDFYKYR